MTSVKKKINLKRKQLSKLHFYVERIQLTHTNKQTKQRIESLTDVTREGSKKKQSEIILTNLPY